jgi:enamine deaminase RidA (YjgF/YER057c/UK114 family)
MTPEDTLRHLGIVLPDALPPSENYLPYRQVGQMLYLSGHGPKFTDNSYSQGRLSTEADIAKGYADAKLAALNILATAKSALGNLDRIEAVIKVLGMVNAEPNFSYHPKVINGCSDLLIAVFGDAGRHARSAVGMGSLPHGMTVEIEVIFLIRD